jgi:hypothetical protein
MTTPIIQTPAPGTVGFDTSASLNASQAAALASSGYRFAIRCIGYESVPVPEPLTASEAATLLAAGLMVGVYQSYRNTGSFTATQGGSDGAYAATVVEGLGAPAGLVIWYDMEGTYPSGSPLYDYLNEWGQAVANAGYAAGLYCGGQNLLTWSQIMALPPFQHYWLAGGYGASWSENQMQVPGRQFQMFQCAPWNLAAGGTAIDVDVAQVDVEGGQPTFWAAS